MYDNQRQTQLAYLAGVLDSDGSFFIQTNKRETKNRDSIRASKFPKKVSSWSASYTPCIKISQIQTEAIELAKEVFNYGKINTFGARPSRPNSMTIYEYKITKTEKIIEIIEMILPYLRIKKNRALHLLEYCRHKLAYGSRCYSGVEIDELNYREDMYQKMRELNGNKVAATTKSLERESVCDSLTSSES